MSRSVEQRLTMLKTGVSTRILEYYTIDAANIWLPKNAPFSALRSMLGPGMFEFRP
jgi:hypothetical protein